MRALRIAVNGTVKPLTLDEVGTSEFLKTAQGEVEGPLELIRLQHAVCLLVNEEGRLRRAEPNLVATKLAQDYGRPVPLLGNVLVLGLVNGELADAPRDVDEYLQLIAPTR